MRQPTLYAVEVTNKSKDVEFIDAMISIFDIDINSPIVSELKEKGRAVVATLPLDIARSKADTFCTYCNIHKYRLDINVKQTLLEWEVPR